MIDFREKMDSIKRFITDAYPKYLEPVGIAPPSVMSEHLDFDRFQKTFTVFVEYQTVNFGGSAWASDCGDIARVSTNIFLAIRKTDRLKDRLYEASSAFYEMFRRERTDIADNITVRELDFFEGVEGQQNVIALARFAIDFEIRYH